jgi:hypothetical protein
MDSRRLQGWQADPLGLHDARYFSAGYPTKLVRDGAAERYDEPPPESWLTAAVAAPVPAPAPVPPEVSPELAEPAAIAAEPVTAPPRKRPWAAFAGAAVIVFGTIGGLIAMTHEVSAASQSGTQAPAAFVAESALQSMARETVEISLSGTVQVSGHTVSLRGTGAVDFTTNAMAVDAGYRFSGYPFAIHMTMTGGYTYLAVTYDGQYLAVSERERAQKALTESEPVSLTNLDLPSAVSGLGELSDAVTALGVKIIDGQSCTGYGVNPATGRAASPLFTTTVWVNSDQLLCQLSEVIPQSAPAGSYAPGGQLVIDFSHYGAPVRITAPARSGTTSGSGAASPSPHGDVAAD